jgi:phage terminase large subunit-like protein
MSVLGIKSYEQGRQSFEGTAKPVIWDDEEPPGDVYTEQLYRTVTTKGIVLVTFTPLQGMSDVVRGFLEPDSDEAREFKWVIQAGWKDVPHLDGEEKRALLASTPLHQIGRCGG